MPPVLHAIALIWMFVAINLLGVRMGGGVQVVTTALKLLPMVFIVGLGGWLLLRDPGRVHATAYPRHRSRSKP